MNGIPSTTVRVADEPADWLTDPWDISLAKKLNTGGGPEIRAVRVSDSEFFYTRVGDNPTSPSVFVSNSVNEGKNYVQKTASAFSGGARYHQGNAVFLDTMWTLGGIKSATATPTNEVYSSTDGATWTLRTTTGVFSARSEFATAVANGKMYVIGGNSGTAALGDLYSTTNGTTWQLVSTAHSLPVRWGHTAVVDGNDDIYVIGGYDGTTRLNDVWKFDGTDWAQVANGGGTRFTARYEHASYYYAGKLWVAAGYDASNGNGSPLQDVWYSSDLGSTWTKSTDLAAFQPRQESASAVFDNRMWILNGRTGFADAYWSTNGLDWYQATNSAEFGARRGAGALAYHNRLWLIAGGASGTTGNTVYYAKNGEP